MGLPASAPQDLGPLGKRRLGTWGQASSLSSPADPHTLSHSPASGTCPGQKPREGRGHGRVHPVLYLSLRWPEASRVERTAVQRPWGGNLPAVFQAQQGWAEGAGTWVRDAAGKSERDNIGPRGGRRGLFRVRREPRLKERECWAVGGVF